MSDVHLKQHIDNMLKVGSPTHIEHDVVVESNNERSIKVKSFIKIPDAEMCFNTVYTRCALDQGCQTT